MSNSLLRTMTDPTSNLSTAKAIYLLCNTQSSGLLSVLNRIPLKQQEIIQNNTCNHKEVCFCNQNQKNDLMDLEFIPKKHIKRFDKNEQILVELNDCDVVIQEYNDLADLLILSRKERIRIFRNDISNRDIKDKMTKLLFENKECLQDYGISRKQFFQTTGGQFVKWAGIGTAAFFLGKAIIGGSSNGGNIIPYQTPVKPF